MRSSRIAVSAFAVAALAASGLSAQQKSLNDQLIGTWNLVSWEQTRPDGSKSQRFGANPKGVQVFDANGRFYLMMARPDLPKFAASDPMKATPEEATQIVQGSLAYFGTYTVNEGDKTINLRMESSTFPNQVGGEQQRVIESLSGDELRYATTRSISGAGNRNTFVWKKAN